jgi:hypothetical protein
MKPQASSAARISSIPSASDCAGSSGHSAARICAHAARSELVNSLMLKGIEGLSLWVCGLLK